MDGAKGTGSRIFKRLLVFNLIAVLIVSIVPQFVFYRYFMTMYNKEVQGLSMQTVRQFQNAVDEPIVKAVVNFPNLYMSELESNDALVYPLTHDISRNSAAILKVSRRMDDIKNNTPYLHSIDLYYPRGNLLFLGDRVCMLNESECALGGREQWFRSFETSDTTIEWVGARKAGPFDPSLIASYVRSIPFFGSKEIRQGVVAVNIDLEELGGLLRSMRPPSEGALLIIDESGEIIARNDTEAPMSNLQIEPFLARLLAGEETDMFDARIGGQASVVSFVTSSYNNWRYVSITSVEDAYRKSNQLRGWMLGIGAAFLAINALITLWLTTRAHRPISNRMENLRQSLARHMPIVRHNYILGLLFGTAQETEKPGDIRSILGFEHNGRQAFGFVLRIERSDAANHEESLAADFHLIEILEGLAIPGDIAAVRGERSQIYGFVSLTGEAELSDTVSRIAAAIKAADEQYVLCLGRVYSSDESSIARSFAEAEEALDYAFLLPGGNALFYEELASEHLKEPSHLPKALDDLPAAIRAGDEKKLFQLIGDLISDIRQGGYTIRYSRNALLDMVLGIDKTMNQLGFQSAEVFGGDLREQYERIGHIEAFEAWMNGVAGTAMGKLNERKEQFDHEFADKIVSFVNNSISHQLSLAYVAEHVGVSPTYLSKIFKGLTGSNFNEYVTGLRLERAASLLLEKKLSVQEISYRVGYQSTHHFIRLFKEKHGLTPKQYQKTYAEDGAKPDEE
ncbi:helix-turn-helix domain-containing protein [Paenibacillus sp. HB172176]|uniref:helix-turn-helix domain-containing protein n=1 Tax=Paenibacillus sp. HB172176 TaxID=2493690 RepID=UPI00143C733F|nr:helix-turn-helix domain-containing protein [Paenibacillus sp. HB172176]